jgi:hypothetical protein
MTIDTIVAIHALWALIIIFRSVVNGPEEP